MKPILIPLKQDRPGFENFIGAWFCPGDPSVVVDVGPSSSIGSLTQSLREMAVRKVDIVLLTHIHVDHAGGLAEFLHAFPMARVICHGKAIGHLIEPDKLWLGTRKALGELAFMYGPINPVERDRLIPHTEAHVPGITVIETPGHAPHHLCFVCKGNLFAGEAGGVYLRAGGLEYLRPATPPIFFLREFLESVDRLILQGDLPIYYSHFGRADTSRLMLQRARDQLLLWDAVASEESSNDYSDVDDLIERCVERLLKEDPELKAINVMAPDDRARELFFLKNSMKGCLMGHLQDRSSHSLK
jgi:glyoxylase-like metal-dependent hydrolase (beta-lactamase superfamily II)